MPITPTATKTGSYSVKYTWSGTAPFDVWQDGRKVLDQTTRTQYVAQPLDATSTPPTVLPTVEIRDDNDTDTASSKVHSPLLRFQWRGQANVVLYIVQEYVVDTWTTRGAVRESGAGYYNYTTTVLADATTHQWRVIAQDENGYQGEALSLTHYMVRNPAPPDVSHSYDAGTGLLTVAAS